MAQNNLLLMFTAYKSWANHLTYSQLLSLHDSELLKPRNQNFGSILHTLYHTYIVDDMFKAHLLGLPHSYTSRVADTCPAIEELAEQQANIDLWYQDFAAGLTDKDADKMIEFQFVDGQPGYMSNSQIIMHVVNHGTYHRGFVSDMMYQVPIKPIANDLTVFLRDAYKAERMAG